MEYLLIGIFLPLFPLSMLFNGLNAAIKSNRQRMLLMLVWPLTGVLLFVNIGGEPPQWLGIWAISTALLYAFRSLVIKDLGIWVAYIWTSTAALLWMLLLSTDDVRQVLLPAVMLLLPVSLMPLLTAYLNKSFGGSYAGAVSGLLKQMPRMTLLLVAGLLAAIATPLFPGFFVMLGMLNQWLDVLPWLSLGLLLIWLLWSWSGLRLLQLFVVGQGERRSQDDLSQPLLLTAVSSLGLWCLLGIWFSGSLL